MTAAGRHRWGEKVVIDLHRSERRCLNGCGTVKVSRHEPDNWPPHWIEYEFAGLRNSANSAGTPPCPSAPAPKRRGVRIAKTKEEISGLL